MTNIRFDLHPLKKESEYIQKNYLTLLLNLAACDGPVVLEEQEYIQNISNELGISEKVLERLEYTEFDTVIEALKHDFVTRKVAYTCFCDLFMLAMTDGEINDEEINFVGALAEEMELDERIFQYLFRISQAISADSENAYLMAILSRHKDVEFGQFQFFFGDIDNFHTREIVKEVVLASRKLKDLKTKLKTVNLKDECAITSTFLDDFQENMAEEIERLEEICHELEDETGEYMTISDEDTYWELEELMSDVSDLLDVLWIHAGSNLLEFGGKFSSYQELSEDAEKLAEKIDETLLYLDEFGNYEKILWEMNGR